MVPRPYRLDWLNPHSARSKSSHSLDFMNPWAYCLTGGVFPEFMVTGDLDLPG